MSLADRFEHVVAVDISGSLIEIARRRRHHPRVDYRIESLVDTVQPGGFDLVFSAFTLHHVPDLDRALVHLRQLIAAGGTAILIDSVAPRPTPPRWVNLAGAIREIPMDLQRHGRRVASWLARFRTSKPWLDHLAGDRYLSRRAFGERYGAVFPGAEFHEVGHGLALVWGKSREPGRTAAGAS